VVWFPLLLIWWIDCALMCCVCSSSVNGVPTEVVQGMVGLEYKNNDEAELRRMSVSRDSRRQANICISITCISCMHNSSNVVWQGIGRMLIDNLIGYAKQQGYKKVLLSTGKHMPLSNALYSSYGFRRVNEDSEGFFYEYAL